MHRSGKTQLALALLAFAGLLALAGCGGGGSGGDVDFTGSGYPGVDTANTRFVGGPINRQTAPSLKVAWKLPLAAESTFGAYASTPVVSKGVIYSQDLESNVQAIDLESGEVLWTKRYEELDQGPNGVVVQEGKVFGATASAAFALDQETGKELWSVPLLRGGGESIDMAPGYHEGLVYVSTVPTLANAEYPGGGVGVLWALDAKTGRKAWHFNTVPDSLWGNRTINAGGGLWYPPSFDEKGSMYFGTGNPVPFPGAPGQPWGASRPGPNLYTNSMVKLDAKTGELRWYYQQTPHDIFDWDFQNPPILTEIGGREVAIGSGKSGMVVALDASSGRPLWKTAVGEHNGHDEDGLRAMRGEQLPATMTVAPGTLGGVIAPMAANETTLFVPVVNHAVQFSASGETNESTPITGEMVALDIETGKEEWSDEYEGAAFGAPVAVNDMVFFATFDGTVHGLDASTGGEVWQEALPAGANTPVMASGDTLLVPAGIAIAEGQKPTLVAYRLGGE
ncbi:MAG: PQQ-binding-like beta-propeller repeat protein [Solirubrobacterales bacterium]